MPQVNPATITLLVVALLGAAWAAGLLRAHYEDGRATLRVSRAGRVVLTLNVRDTWLLLAMSLLMGWAVAAAVERSAWVPGFDTEGRLVPALALTSVLGWLFACAGFRRFAYGIASLAAALVSLALFTPSPLTTSGLSVPALVKWSTDLPAQTNLLLLMGLILMFALAGAWTSWWIFRRHNGLVALLPTGTILAVEIINDTSAGLGFFVVVWLAAAASVLLRLNFVALKDSWRARRLPHAADTGWTFGEVGAEATVAILAIAFLILPPLSSSDISGTLIPGVVHADLTHPFGIGSGSGGGGGIGSIGYSETVQPGSQLKAKSQTVMRVSGDAPTYYPYWRGVALAGWDGIKWYLLPSTQEVPVRQQPVVAAGAAIPRDDLPSDSQRIQIQHDTFQVIVPPVQTVATAFSAGEIVTVNQPTTVRGIMTSETGLPGPGPALVNVTGDNLSPSTFDTIDRIHLANRVRAPYTFSVTEVIPNAAVDELKTAGTNYPAWIAPYTTVYYQDRMARGTGQDAQIAALAQSIVHDANATTPYDQARAIESWFNEKGRFTYTLAGSGAPANVRPLDWFLFNSRKGLCQDFSTAMNVMLRMLGIPSRQISGFGQGILDDKTHQYIVNALDAHSWVEVYFPGYGWIPFEATPDGVNQPISRPLTRALLNVPSTPSTEATPRPRPIPKDPVVDTGGSTSNGAFPNIWRQALLGGGALLLVVIIGILLAVRWLLAVKDVPRIWRRLLFLGDRLKVPRHRGDTPQEFGGRLATFVPPLDEEVRRLANLYTRASFRREGLSADELADARDAWQRIRGSYAGLVVGAWRDALRRGRVVSAEEGAASESPEPSRRR
ncbi:MAG TPA: transglutaminase domain-containing protein [Candidatus Dormibacteraeota bacterium]|nr:transglutaminase domain-containing protein [Candidatus Dormibacteraeota bacterium]